MDGTTNFVHGYPLFAISIGLFYKKEPLVAVVVEMPNMRMYTAIKGQGAWWKEKSIVQIPRIRKSYWDRVWV
ncbi:hypothetical protein Ct9H90mP29_22970 [bacterium]|nr:MAG: hypothetical protein Ct9H90mP29_22970 [bacterium]